MLTREGNLFHIDFGHFLGNYKKKYGIKRERAPFIFTPQYAHVLDGKNGKPFSRFVEICCMAFNILRRHKDMFITLFQMVYYSIIKDYYYFLLINVIFFIDALYRYSRISKC